MSRKICILEIFKATILVCIIFTLFFAISACKETATEEGEWEEEEEEEAKEEEVEEESEAEMPIIEETPEKIEWEGITFSPIEGLRFDEGIFFAEAGNLYGLEAGEKAGVFIKDAVEINGVMESSIGLKPEVIEVMQKEIIEKDKEFKYPLPFDFEKAKGIKVREVLMAQHDKEGNLSFDTSYKNHVLGVEAPVGTTLYSPLTTDICMIISWEDFSSDGKELGLQWVFSFRNLSSEGKFNGVKIDERFFDINAGDVEIYPKTTSREDVYDGAPISKIKIGEPLAKVNHETYFGMTEDERKYKPSGQYQFMIDYPIRQGQNYYRSIDIWSIQDLIISIYSAQ